MEIKRDRYLQQLIESRQDGFIKVVTGIRRCGKSYLLNVLFYHYLLENGIADDHIIRIDLEDRMNKASLCSRQNQGQGTLLYHY